MKSALTSTMRSPSRGSLAAIASGTSSLLHSYRIDDLANTTLVDGTGSLDVVDEDGVAVLSAATGGHPTLQSLDLTAGSDSAGSTPFYAGGASGYDFNGGTLCWLFATHPVATGGRFMSRTVTTDMAFVARGTTDFQFTSGAQYKRFLQVDPLTEWQTLAVYAESNTGIGTGEIVIRLWHNGVELSASASVATGASATTNPPEAFLGNLALVADQYMGDMAFFDVTEGSCIADMLAEEAIMREKWVDTDV